MDRRDLLKSTLAAALPSAAVASELTVEPEAKLVAFVVKCDHYLSLNARSNLSANVKDAFANTEWKDVPVLVADKGLDIQLMQWPRAQQITPFEGSNSNVVGVGA